MSFILYDTRVAKSSIFLTSAFVLRAGFEKKAVRGAFVRLAARLSAGRGGRKRKSGRILYDFLTNLRVCCIMKSGRGARFCGLRSKRIRNGYACRLRTFGLLYRNAARRCAKERRRRFRRARATVGRRRKEKRGDGRPLRRRRGEGAARRKETQFLQTIAQLCHLLYGRRLSGSGAAHNFVYCRRRGRNAFMDRHPVRRCRRRAARLAVYKTQKIVEAAGRQVCEGRLGRRRDQGGGDGADAAAARPVHLGHGAKSVPKDGALPSFRRSL